MSSDHPMHSKLRHSNELKSSAGLHEQDSAENDEEDGVLDVKEYHDQKVIAFCVCPYELGKDGPAEEEGKKRYDSHLHLFELVQGQIIYHE